MRLAAGGGTREGHPYGVTVVQVGVGKAGVCSLDVVRACASDTPGPPFHPRATFHSPTRCALKPSPLTSPPSQVNQVPTTNNSTLFCHPPACRHRAEREQRVGPLDARVPGAPRQLRQDLPHHAGEGRGHGRHREPGELPCMTQVLSFKTRASFKKKNIQIRFFGSFCHGVMARWYEPVHSFARSSCISSSINLSHPWHHCQRFAWVDQVVVLDSDMCRRWQLRVRNNPEG